MNATELFENAMDWLQQHYGEYRFFTERDVEWTLQKRILEMIEGLQLPYHVVNNYTIVDSVQTDLVIISGTSVEVAVEFKYEPSHARSTKQGGDIWSTKFSSTVVFWTVTENSKDGSVEKDIRRVCDYVDQGRAKVAYAVFIDEGGYFHGSQDTLARSKWRDWGGGRWVLWSKVTAS